MVVTARGRTSPGPDPWPEFAGVANGGVLGIGTVVTVAVAMFVDVAVATTVGTLVLVDVAPTGAVAVADSVVVRAMVAVGSNATPSDTIGDGVATDGTMVTGTVGPNGSGVATGANGVDTGSAAVGVTVDTT